MRPASSTAYILSWLSLFASMAAAVAGLTVFLLSHASSSSILGFVLENIVDGVASALCLWRFWGGGASVPTVVLELREKRTSVGIAFAFILLAIVVASTATAHLSEVGHATAADFTTLAALCVPSVVVFALLGLAKLQIGIALKSATLKKDAACSLCGAVLSAGALAGAAAPEHTYIDALIALIVCAGLLCFGLWTLLKNARQQNMWWRVAWWMSPTHDGAATGGGGKGGTRLPVHWASPPPRRGKSQGSNHLAPHPMAHTPSARTATPSDSSGSSPSEDGTTHLTPMSESSYIPYEPSVPQVVPVPSSAALPAPSSPLPAPSTVQGPVEVPPSEAPSTVEVPVAAPSAVEVPVQSPGGILLYAPYDHTDGSSRV